MTCTVTSLFQDSSITFAPNSTRARGSHGRTSKYHIYVLLKADVLRIRQGALILLYVTSKFCASQA
jgi:hypothetical protein